MPSVKSRSAKTKLLFCTKNIQKYLYHDARFCRAALHLFLSDRCKSSLSAVGGDRRKEQECKVKEAGRDRLA